MTVTGCPSHDTGTQPIWATGMSRSGREVSLGRRRDISGGVTGWVGFGNLDGSHSRVPVI